MHIWYMHIWYMLLNFLYLIIVEIYKFNFFLILRFTGIRFIKYFQKIVFIFGIILLGDRLSFLHSRELALFDKLVVLGDTLQLRSAENH